VRPKPSKQTLFIALAIASLALVEGVGFWGDREAAGAVAWRRHTQEALLAISEVNERKDHTESLVREYVLTGVEPLALRAGKNSVEIHQRLAHARQLMGDNPNQVPRLARLNAILRELTDRWTITVATRRAQGAEAASQLVADGTGRRLTDEAELILDEMEAGENRLLRERSARAERFSLLSSAAMKIGGGLTLLFGFLAWRALRAATAAARESEESLDITLHSIGDAVLATDAEGRITRLNSVAEKLTGWKHSDVSGRPAAEVFHIVNETTHQPAFLPVADTLAKGAIHGLANHTLLIARDGTERPIADSCAPIRDREGQVIGAVLVFRDVSEERRAGAAQRTSEERFRALVSASARMIWRTDAGGLITEPVPDWEAFVGQPPGESVKNDWGNYIHADDVARLQAEFCQGIAGKKIFTMEFRARRHDGVHRELVSLAAPVLGADGSVREWIGSLNDVTEKKEAELALRRALDDLSLANAGLAQASKHKDQFLANMSHELRTPLNAILGFSEILEDQTFGPLNPKQTRYIGIILSSGHHLLQLINDILDLAKIESGRLELYREDVAPAQAIADVLAVVKGIAGKKSIHLRTECAAGLPLLDVDPAKFKQVFYNLLSNAVKFTHDGGTVTVKAEVIADCGLQIADSPSPGELASQSAIRNPQSAIRISVSDTGIGITPADQPRLFKEFEQVDSTYGRTQQGTGLGLALTKKLVELHGGRIALESEGVEGRGTTFHVELPLKPAAAPGQPGALPMPLPEISGEMTFAQSGGSRPLVLVVEDEPQAAGILYAYLLSSGYDVAHARTGDEALRLAGELKPFAITLDILMPGKTGWEVLAELKMDPGTRDIPVVIVSITDDKQLGFSLGAVDFIVKPIGRERLLEAIRKAGEFARHTIHTVLVVDDEPKAVEAIAAQVRAAGFKVFEAFSGRQALELAVDKLPDLMILDLIMPGVNGFEVLDCLRVNPLTFQMPVLIHTAKDLTNEERTHLSRQAQGITHKGAAADLLAELQRLAERKLEPTTGRGS